MFTVDKSSGFSFSPFKILSIVLCTLSFKESHAMYRVDLELLSCSVCVCVQFVVVVDFTCSLCFSRSEWESAFITSPPFQSKILPVDCSFVVHSRCS